MRGDIFAIDAEKRLCFGFVAADLTEDDEDRFARAVAKSCHDGGGCRAGGSALIEFAALGRTKLEAMGAPASARTGFSLGWRPPPADWQRIEAGERTFDFAMSGDGIDITLAGPSTARKTFEEDSVMENGTIFKLSRETPGFDLIRKCVRAAQDGDITGLTRSDFEGALDALAKAYAAESRLDFHAAYAAVLATPLGSQLYSGHCHAAQAEAAPRVSKAAARLSKRDEAWAAIEQAATARRKEAVALGDAPLTQEAAITAVCREQPQLYSDYVAAGGADDAA